MSEKTRRLKEAGRLLRRLFPSGEAEPFFAALSDARAHIVESEGEAAARRWHRKQVFRSAPGLVWNSIGWKGHLLAHDLKIARRDIGKHKSYSLIAVAGLAVGAAACLLISLFVRQELSFDAYHQDGDRIFRLLVKADFGKGQPISSVSELAAPTLLRDFPEVEAAARVIQPFRAPVLKSGEKVFAEEEILYADPSLFRILTIPFRRGRPEDALTQPGTIVLTQSLAAKYFGSANAVGEILFVDGASVKITGIIEDAPVNSHLRYRGFRPYRTVEGRGQTPSWERYDPRTYLKIKPGTDPAAIGAKIARLSEPYLKRERSSAPIQEYEMQPIRRIHLDTRVDENNGAQGNPGALFLLSGLALVILILACLNFVNLSTARSSGRAKEVGVRKTLGAERPRLVFQFLGESFLITFLAYAAGLLLAGLALVPFNRFAQTTFAFADLVRPGMMGIAVGLFLLTGLAAGLYPAAVLSSHSPASALRKDASARLKGGRLRRVFVVGQFAVAVALIAITLTMSRQIRFMKNAPLGFVKEQKLVVVFPGGRGSLPSGISADRQASIKQELARHPGVRSATLSSSVPGRGFYANGTFLSGQDSKQSRSVRYLFADEDFMSVYGLELAAGRWISNGGMEGEILLNETATKSLGWRTPEEALGRKIMTGNTGEREVVGIVRDFHLEGLQNAVLPLGMGRGPRQYHMVTLTFNAASLGAVLEHVRRTWAALVPDNPLDYFFLDDLFARLYATEERTAGLFSAFAALGIMIACLGLFGLASFLAEKRTKEIGIRKILGASTPRILGLLSREFAAAVLIANAIAWPAAYFGAKSWMEDFAFRSGLSIWTFVTAGGMALAVAMISVALRSWRAARTNPVESLRYE